MDLCIDIGGTKTAVACYDQEKRECFYKNFPTRPELGCKDLALRVYELIHEQNIFFERACIASPGPLDMSAGKILKIATMGWNDVPICELFEKIFHTPFLLINDCTAGALGEWIFGQRQEVSNLAYISVSTGVGGGLIINNRLCLGKGNGGEIGHLQVRGDGLSCACGQYDCLELYASGTGIESGYFRNTGKKRNCREIAQLAREGDANAVDAFRKCGEALSEGINSIIKIVDPERIVLGGGVIADQDLFFPSIKTRFPNTDLVLTHLGGKQVLYGCLAFLDREKYIV